MKQPYLYYISTYVFFYPFMKIIFLHNLKKSLIYIFEQSTLTFFIAVSKFHLYFFIDVVCKGTVYHLGSLVVRCSVRFVRDSENNFKFFKVQTSIDEHLDIVRREVEMPHHNLKYLPLSG